MLDVSKAHDKTPFALVQPFLDSLGVIVARSLRRRPDVVAEITSFLGMPRQGFLQTALSVTVPALVLSKDKDAISSIASVLDQRFGQLLLDHMAEILTHIFLRAPDIPASIKYLVSLFMDKLDSRTANHATAASLIASCHMNLAVALIIELGDEDQSLSQAAADGLIMAHRYQRGDESEGTIADFLKPVMLGIMTHLNETLHDMRGRKTVAYKRKLIRSLAELIGLFGKPMSVYSPQVSLPVERF